MLDTTGEEVCLSSTELHSRTSINCHGSESSVSAVCVSPCGQSTQASHHDSRSTQIHCRTCPYDIEVHRRLRQCVAVLSKSSIHRTTSQGKRQAYNGRSGNTASPGIWRRKQTFSERVPLDICGRWRGRRNCGLTRRSTSGHWSRANSERRVALHVQSQT